jgi:hypothetical protein
MQNFAADFLFEDEGRCLPCGQKQGRIFKTSPMVRGRKSRPKISPSYKANPLFPNFPVPGNPVVQHALTRDELRIQEQEERAANECESETGSENRSGEDGSLEPDSDEVAAEYSEPDSDEVATSKGKGVPSLRKKKLKKRGKGRRKGRVWSDEWFKRFDWLKKIKLVLHWYTLYVCLQRGKLLSVYANSVCV